MLNRRSFFNQSLKQIPIFVAYWRRTPVATEESLLANDMSGSLPD
jgi:hypothetical protein